MRETMDKAKRWAVLCGVLSVAFIGIIFIGNGRLSDLQIEATKNRSEISELTAELAKLKEQSDYVPSAKLNDEEKEAVSHSAAELGNAIAGYQNAYFSLNASENRDAFQANVDALDICFTDGSKSARVPWYSGKTPGTWTFVTDGEFKGVNKEVLWLCRSTEDGSLLAYATGLYDSELNLVGDVEFQTSILGSQSADATGVTPTPEIDMEQVNQMTEQIANTDVPQERQQTDEELTKLHEAQSKLWEAHMKELEEGGSDSED